MLATLALSAFSSLQAVRRLKQSVNIFLLSPHRLLPSSLSTLDAATRLRTEGAIPESVQLWAVANPNVEENAALVEQKVCCVLCCFLRAHCELDECRHDP